MSLLEDVFLEDEAGEAQELERFIEGDEYDERPRPSTPDSNEDSEKEDEAEEDKRHVDPTSAKPKRIVKNPRVVLNPARLTGPRGIQVIPNHFKDFTFKGKGHEKEDLDLVLKKLEHWAYRLYPKFEFKDCLKKIETLGKKRPVMVHLTKIRTDQFMSDETVVQRESSDEEAPQPAQEEDEFDKLLRQQIELARATPVAGTAKGFTTPMADKTIMPKATSSPSINEEQRERMLRNRQLAEERRIARLTLNKSNTGHETSNNNVKTSTTPEKSTNTALEEDLRDNNMSQNNKNENAIETLASNTIRNRNDKMHDAEENITRAKSNRSNVLDSSDSEDDALIINESVTVDVHSHRNYDNEEESDISHQNENDKEVNSDIVHHKQDDDEIHSNIVQNEQGSDNVQENENEQDSDMEQQNKNKERKETDEINSDMVNNENENHSGLDHQNKNTVEEISEETSDVEMIDKENESSINKNDKTADLNKDTTSDLDIEEIPKNNIDSEMLQTIDSFTVVNKQISENENNSRNAAVESVENTKAAEKNIETAIADVDDIMDVDFGDDF